MNRLIDTQSIYGSVKEIDFRLDLFKRLRSAYSKGYDISFMVIPLYPQLNSQMPILVHENPDLISGAYLLIVPKKGLPWVGGGDIPYTSPEELHKLVEKGGIVGFNIATTLTHTPIDSPLLIPYIELAKSVNKTVLIHCSSLSEEEIKRNGKTPYTTYRQKRNFLERYSGQPVKIIFEHAGGLNPQKIELNLGLAREFENLYLNTAGMSGEKRQIDNGSYKLAQPTLDNIQLLLWKFVLKKAMNDEVLRQKFLFASDFPWLDRFDLHIELLESLTANNQLQLLNNATRVFGLEEKVLD